MLLIWISCETGMVPQAWDLISAWNMVSAGRWHVHHVGMQPAAGGRIFFGRGGRTEPCSQPAVGSQPAGSGKQRKQSRGL